MSSHGAFTVADIDQNLQHREDIFPVQYARPNDLIVATYATVELHPTNGRQIVTVFREEQVLEQVLGSFLGRRLTRTHHAVDFNQRFQFVRGRIGSTEGR